MSNYPAPELFRNYPELREKLPWVPLAHATPVDRLGRLESFLHAPLLWVKRDDRTSDAHGGAKPRQLEFVFGDLLRRGARRVLVFGRVGSPNCLAMTVFAHRFRLRPVLALVRARGAQNVQRSLEIEHQLGAELHRLDAGPHAAARLVRSILASRHDEDEPRFPAVLWPRRAALYGALGYVNAAYELKRQINVGILPEPSRIYVPARSGATAAGLALGCQMAGIRATVIAVTGATGGHPRPAALAARTLRALRARTRRIALTTFDASRLVVRRDFAGTHDAARAAAHQALGLARDLEHLDLEGATGGRVMAALFDDVRHSRVHGPLLFWHTHAADARAAGNPVDAQALPREFREFFLAR